jgi:hypothetical protein
VILFRFFYYLTSRRLGCAGGQGSVQLVSDSIFFGRASSSRVLLQRRLVVRCVDCGLIVITAPPPRPSVQTSFVLEAMAAAEKAGAVKWDQVLSTLDTIVQRIESVERAQQQLAGQQSLANSVAEQAARARDEMARQIAETGKRVASLTLEQMAAGMEQFGDGSPASPSTSPVFASDLRRDVPPGGHRAPHDRGGHRRRHGERGGRHEPDGHQEFGEAPPPFMKFSFPKFGGESPSIWLDKCHDYFQMYQVPRSIWVMAASMHMEGKAAKWLQVFKLHHALGNWEHFSSAVLDQFGLYEYPKAMDDLLNLRQTGSLEEYVSVFDDLRYSTAVHNPQLDEIFFVAQFVKGLKREIQGPVRCQVPTTVNRAVLLATLQQDVLDKSRPKFQSTVGGKRGIPGLPADSQEGVGLSKERQLRDYRRAHGLCFTCGDKFDAGHAAKCGKRVPAVPWPRRSAS